MCSVIIVKGLYIDVLFIGMVVKCIVIYIIMVVVLWDCDIVICKCCDFWLVVLEGIIGRGVVILCRYGLRYFDWIWVGWRFIGVKDLYEDVVFVFGLGCVVICVVVIFLC